MPSLSHRVLTIALTAATLVACSEDDDGTLVPVAGDTADTAVTAPPTVEPVDNNDDVPSSMDAGTDDDVNFGPGTGPVVVEEPEPLPPEPAPSDEDTPTEENPLVACPGAVAVGEDPVIDDFEDLNLRTLQVDNREGDWYSYTDTSTDDTQTLEFATTDEPAVDGSGVLHVTGPGSFEYSGVGMGFRWTETGTEYCYYDASYYDGVSFWARGNASLRFAIQNPSVRPVASGGGCPADATCYDAHGYDFTLTETWTQYQIAFSALEQQGWGTPVGPFLPNEAFTMEFQFLQGTSYELYLDDVSFYRAVDLVEPEPTVDVDAGSDAGSPDGGSGEQDSDAGTPVADASVE